MKKGREMIVLAVNCRVCGDEMLLTIPLDAVHLEWEVTCPKCYLEDHVPSDVDGYG